MNNLVKIRVNFKRENCIEGVNMSKLCDILIQNLSKEIKEELKRTPEDEYLKIITKINNLKVEK